MDLGRLYFLTERLRKEAIGEPEWIDEKHVFEYRERNAKIVAVLKLTRAAHGVSAIKTLCEAGLFIDAGAIMRSVGDCADEIHFLLEEYPKSSAKVDQFVSAFFAATIDGHLDDETPPVPTKKIRAAAVRTLQGRQDDRTQKNWRKSTRPFAAICTRIMRTSWKFTMAEHTISIWQAFRPWHNAG